MDTGNHSPLRARLKIDGGGSSTAFASATGSRWVWTAGNITWANLDTSCTFSLYEFNATNSAQFWQFLATATNGIVNIEFGDIGIQASSSYSSRMVFNTGAVAGTVCGLFVGYQTGS